MSTPSSHSRSSLALRNIGPKSAAMLAQIGVRSATELRQRGAVATYAALKQQVPGVSLNMLYALVGAINNEDWREIKRTQRLELLNALAAYEEKNGVRLHFSKEKNGV